MHMLPNQWVGVTILNNFEKFNELGDITKMNAQQVC